MRIHTITFFLFTVLFQNACTLIPDCQAVQKFWQKNFHSSPYPSHAVNNDICLPAYSRSPNCCDHKMLTDMMGSSERDLSSRLKAVFPDQAEQFRKDCYLLKSFVTETLGLTMSNLDSQFKRDLDYIYAQHKPLFLDFFSRIQGYLFGENSNVDAMVESFFDELLLRMTQILLNVKPANEIAYAKCFASKLRTKRPFGNATTTIIKMTKEAFPPMRLVINSMAFAHEVLRTSATPAQLPPACTSTFMKLKFCNLCSGYISLSPCDANCAELANLCVPQQTALSSVWRDFIASLQPALDLLEKFPQVHRPLQVHLTDGIMNMKSVFTSHEQEINQVCSPSITPSQQGANTRRFLSPPLFRPTRQAPPLWDRVFLPKPMPSVALAGSGIANLKFWAKNLQQKYTHVKSLFDDVGLELCKDSSIPTHGTQSTTSCWNGSAVESITTINPRSYVSRSNSGPSDPSLNRMYNSLQMATKSLRSVINSPEDPPVIALADPSATVLTTAKDRLPVSSDEEALYSYLNSDQLPSNRQPPTYPNNNNMPNSQGQNLHGQAPPLATIRPDPQPPASVAPNFMDPLYPPHPPNQWPAPELGYPGGNSYESSGYPNPGNPDNGPYALLPVDDEDNKPFGGNVASLPLPGGQGSSPYSGHTGQPLPNPGSPVSEIPAKGYLPDDEDYKQHQENSAYAPVDNYPYTDNQVGAGQMPPIAGDWSTSPDQQPSSPYDPLSRFDGGPAWPEVLPEGEENSGKWPNPPYGEPLPETGGGDIWGAMKPEKPKLDEPDLSSLGNGGGLQQEIPSQIWIPDREGVVHMSIPPQFRTTSSSPIQLPSILLTLTLSAVLFQ